MPSVQVNSVPGIGDCARPCRRMLGKPVTELLPRMISAIAPVQGQRPDGDRKRRQTEPGDQEAVEGAGDDPHHQDRDYGQREGPAVLEKVAEQRTGQPERRGHRQVDLARHDDKGKGQGHEGALGRY